ncbi:unnamed protein product [Closterium sp. NIES-65]|nr:unnamed protein product [Closterium sp. NIES-65]
MVGVVETWLGDESAAAAKSGLVTTEGEKGFANSTKVQKDGCAEKDSENDGADAAGGDEGDGCAEEDKGGEAETEMVRAGDVGKGKGKVGETEGAGTEDVVASESDGGYGEDDGSSGAGCGESSAVAASTGMLAAAASEEEAEEGVAASGMEVPAGSAMAKVMAGQMSMMGGGGSRPDDGLLAGLSALLAIAAMFLLKKKADKYSELPSDRRWVRLE